ncbi:Poly-beta-1,6-N-acetyl-D-glucosamine synthase [Corynebacterium glaucum]|uniref:Poly-beta-1,6-N-acetyl-D-glucosamine synthase n=1 Tax=Corynebacterium glaucum TaxID=187491 RepID=A0A1Q2HUS2_9CORY|nr:glycosyltransferase family 2 protein [Corynebacterium glaucum]AQQ14598.1 Poly-beta-1,6-N-acetyl-D-glucosamine synthase [Corynebacterium glaucum]
MAFLVFTMALLVMRVLFVPLALIFEYRAARRRAAGTPTALDRQPLVSVVVPAYNEETVLKSCVTSIVGSGYPNLEVIVVDDGSSDDTRRIAQELESRHPQMRYIYQENAGKGAALNHGYRESRGEFLLFIDADSVFTPDTVPAMLRAFYVDDIGAVCGDDRPVNLNRVLTRFLALITHVGTGLVRRAFDLLGVVPVVSGNSGAFRRACLDDVARATPGRPLREDTVGEDLELTWHIHTTPWRVVFAPEALVYAESPSSLKALYKQRTRWARGLLQSLQIYWPLMFRPSNPAFTGLLWFTVITMVFFPVLQIGLFIAMLVSLPNANFTAWGLLLGSGLLLSTVLLIITMVIANALGDLRHIWALPLWPIYSLAMSFTMLNAMWQELTRSELKWNKPERTGVISFEEQLGLEAGADSSGRSADRISADQFDAAAQPRG